MIARIMQFGEKVLEKLRLRPDQKYIAYVGPFETWELAVESSDGYDSPYVLKKVREGVLRVLQKERAYERDGTAFVSMPRKYTLRSQIKALLRRDSVIVDFGGGLGGTFVNNRDLFSLDWDGSYYVVEQIGFCKTGCEISAKYNLPIRFVENISQITLSPDIFIFSGVLSHISDWHKVVSDALKLKPRFVIVDRQRLTNGETQIYVQENGSYYEGKANYPSRVINKVEFMAVFSEYKVVEEWQSDFDPAGFQGFLLQLTPSPLMIQGQDLGSN